MKNELKREIITTADGSTTIHFPELNEHYHSKHGAINEAMHVFIKNGFSHVIGLNTSTTLNILEIGFGTGLNAFITFLESQKRSHIINYVGVEGYPISSDEVGLLNYHKMFFNSDLEKVFYDLHQSPWEEPFVMSPNFVVTKRKQFFLDIDDENCYNLIYFDAFGARVQPELWTEDIFEKMYKALQKGGVLVTYAAKGSVRRAMQTVGFVVERLSGPPGKREMLRATKV